MNMLYDSESYVVLHVVSQPTDAPSIALEEKPSIPRHGFEIVDKLHRRGVYLDGAWAERFQEQIDAWQRNKPSQEEVESTLEAYASLAQTPLHVH